MIKVNKKIDSFPHLDLDVLLNSYMNGIFPMAESKIDESVFLGEAQTKRNITFRFFSYFQILKKTHTEKPFNYKI